MQRKELEMEMQLFDENGELNHEYQKEALEIKDLDSTDDDAPKIRSRSPVKRKETRNRIIFMALPIR